jgi:hypothetical protein
MIEHVREDLEANNIRYQDKLVALLIRDIACATDEFAGCEPLLVCYFYLFAEGMKVP